MATPRYSVIDPARLSRMVVLDTLDSEATLIQRMLRLKALWAEKDPPAAAQYDVDNLEFDPIRINQELNTFMETLLRDRVNQAARAVTLAYAIGSDLDAIASRYPGGVPRLANEGDERYRRRVWASVNPLSPHGTTEAYEFWALTADASLRDATATKSRPMLTEDPVITITCMLEGPDPSPTMAQLLAVRRYLIDERRAGATDVLAIRAPIVIEADYKLDVWLYPGTDDVLAISQVRASVEAFVERQRWLGYDHMRSAIYAAASLSDVHSVDIISPAEDVRVLPTQVVKVKSITITYKGRRE